VPQSAGTVTVPAGTRWLSAPATGQPRCGNDGGIEDAKNAEAKNADKAADRPQHFGAVKTADKSTDKGGADERRL